MTDFEATKLERRVDADNAYALRTDRLGKRLVRKTVRMIESGTVDTRLRSFALSLGLTDPESVTLALNAELARQQVDARAEVAEVWNGSSGDPVTYNHLRLTEVAGQPAIPQQAIDARTNAVRTETLK